MKHTAIPLLIALSATAHQTLQATELDPLHINVTATRISYPIDRIAANVSSITREQLAEKNITTLVEAIALLPGVYVAQSGSIGSSTTFYIRGAESNHTVVLINGIRATSSVSGYTELQYIPLNSVDRIEIVRGGLSALYGSNAIGGVIQIFTNEPQTETSEVSLALGSQNTGKFGVTHGNRLSNGGYYTISLGTDRTSGYDTANGSWSSPDDDGMINRALHFDISTPLKEWNIGFSARYNDGTAEWDDGETDFSTSLASIGASRKLGNGQFKTSAAQTRTIHDNSAFDEYPFSSEQYKAEYEHYTTDRLTTLYGVERLDESTTGLNLSSNALFTSLNYTVGKHSLNASARLENQVKFGSHTTSGLGYAYAVTNNTELFMSYRESFAAPSFEDYIYDVNQGAGIAPELAKSNEIGLRYSDNRFSLATSMFRTRTTDLIKAEKVDPGCFYPCDYAYSNIADSETRGIEIESNFSFDRSSINFNYTYLDPENITEGGYLSRRPMHNANLETIINVTDRTKFQVGSSLRAGMYDSEAKLPTVTLWTFNTSHKISENLDIGLKIDNVFNKRYESLKGYPGRERYLEMKAIYRF